MFAAVLLGKCVLQKLKETKKTYEVQPEIYGNGKHQKETLSSGLFFLRSLNKRCQKIEIKIQ